MYIHFCPYNMSSHLTPFMSNLVNYWVIQMGTQMTTCLTMLSILINMSKNCMICLPVGLKLIFQSNDLIFVWILVQLVILARYLSFPHWWPKLTQKFLKSFAYCRVYDAQALGMTFGRWDTVESSGNRKNLLLFEKKYFCLQKLWKVSRFRFGKKMAGIQTFNNGLYLGGLCTAGLTPGASIFWGMPPWEQSKAQKNLQLCT